VDHKLDSWQKADSRGWRSSRGRLYHVAALEPAGQLPGKAWYNGPRLSLVEDDDHVAKKRSSKNKFLHAKSRQQRTVLIVTAIIAVIMVLSMIISMLPPPSIGLLLLSFGL